jgi:hypothetical protein
MDGNAVPFQGQQQKPFIAKENPFLSEWAGEFFADLVLILRNFQCLTKPFCQGFGFSPCSPWLPPSLVELRRDKPWETAF